MELRNDVTFEAVRRAKKYGKTVIFNPAPASGLPDELYPMIDYLTPNETELSVLTGLPAETPEQIAAAAAVLRKRGTGNVIVTCGARGVYADAENFCGFRAPDAHVRALGRGRVLCKKSDLGEGLLCL